MAREVAAHADFQGANRFGRLAAEAAEQGDARGRGRREGSVEAGPRRRTIAPAKDAPRRPKDEVAPAKDDAIAPAKDTP